MVFSLIPDGIIIWYTIQYQQLMRPQHSKAKQQYGNLWCTCQQSVAGFSGQCEASEVYAETSLYFSDHLTIFIIEEFKLCQLLAIKCPYQRDVYQSYNQVLF